MGKVIPMLGGGGGADLDMITAGAGDVLSEKVIVDRDGNSLTGTMRHLTNESTIQHAQGNGTRVVIGDEAYVSTNTDGVRRAEIRYNGGGGYIAGNTLLGVEQGKMAEAIGLTGDKLIAGSNVLGVAGDPGVKNTRDANLNPDYLVQGQSGYDDGVLKWGNMPDCGNWGANVGMNGSVGIPYGRHGGGGFVHGPSVPYQNADVAGTDRARATQRSCWDGTVNLGVRNGHYLNGVNWIQHDDPNFRAANIKKGVPIMGLIGTFEGYVPTATDLYNNGHNPAGLRNPTGYVSNRVTFETGMFTFPYNSTLRAVVYTNGKINFAGYTRLNIDINILNRYEITTSLVGISLVTMDTPIENSNQIPYDGIGQITNLGLGRQTVSIPFSGLSYTKYLCILFRELGGNIYRVWLS